MGGKLFREVQLHNRSFMQKLLNQLPVENAIIELNNLLATRSPRQITSQNIRKIEEKYKVSLSQEFMLNLQEFYAVYLNFILSNAELDDEKEAELYHFQTIMRLDSNAVAMLKEKVGAIAFKCILNDNLKRKVANPSQERKLKAVKEYCLLPDLTVEKVSIEVYTNHIAQYIKRCINRMKYSAEEELELNTLFDTLNIHLPLKKEVSDQLKKLKHYAKLESEELSAVSVDEPLQKNEVCYGVFEKVKWFECVTNKQSKLKVDFEKKAERAKKIHLHSRHVSVFGNQYRLKLKDTGRLLITNKRVLLIGSSKTSNIRLEKITDFNAYIDGAEILKDTGNDVVLNIQKESDIFSIILSRLLKSKL